MKTSQICLGLVLMVTGGHCAMGQSVTPKGPLVLTNKVPLLQPPAMPAANVHSPGVYRAEPYSLMVLVPGTHADDRIVLGRSPESQRMPMFAPELRLVPRNAARLKD